MTHPVRNRAGLVPAVFARSMGWGVGTKLKGSRTNLEGSAYIEITAIGEKMVLGKRIPPDKNPGGESSWSFDVRDWEVIKPNQYAGLAEQHRKKVLMDEELRSAEVQAEGLKVKLKEITEAIRHLRRELNQGE